MPITHGVSVVPVGPKKTVLHTHTDTDVFPGRNVTAVAPHDVNVVVPYALEYVPTVYVSYTTVEPCSTSP